MTGHFERGVWVEDPEPLPPLPPIKRELPDLFPISVEYRRCDGSIGFMTILNIRTACKPPIVTWDEKMENQS